MSSAMIGRMIEHLHQTTRTLAAIVADLNDRAVPTARGGRWHPSTVAHVARSVALDAELASA